MNRLELNTMVTRYIEISIHAARIAKTKILFIPGVVIRNTVDAKPGVKVNRMINFYLVKMVFSVRFCVV